MSNPYRPYLMTLLGLLELGRRWMNARRIPLWVAPVALVVLFAGCNAAFGGKSRARGAQAQAVASCYRTYAHRYGDGSFNVTEYRRSDNYDVVRARVDEGSLDCMTGADSGEVVMFKIW